MTDPKKQSDLDQSLAVLADQTPPYWSRIFKNLKAEGFKDAEALAVLQTYILSQGAAPVIAPKP